MVRKFISVLLILLVPMQAMAALTMNSQMQQTTSIAFSSAVTEVRTNHACHQEISTAPTGVPDEVSAASQSDCYSCVLCMAFGLAIDPLFLAIADHLKQSESHFTQTFISADLFGPIKPPIL